VSLIDSHCHLDFPDFAGKIDETIARAKAAGVDRLITIGTRTRQGAKLQEIAEAHEEVFFTLGVHPHYAAEEGVLDITALRGFAAHRKCVGLGEAGLDHYYKRSPPEVAERVFREQIGLARELDLPLVIHTRDAEDDTARILREEMAAGKFRALLHCFTSSRALAEAALALGLSISFSGVLTFKNSDDLRETAKIVPMDRVLVETDAPYLTPVPHRGKRNEPAFVADTARVLAEVKGVGYDEISASTRANTLKLFDKIEGRA